MAESFLTFAAETALAPFAKYADRILPWASASPIWSGPRPAEVERAGGRYGSLIATPAARGSWQLCHAPGERMHVLTLHREPCDVEEHEGRRWRVITVRGPECAAGMGSAA